MINIKRRSDKKMFMKYKDENNLVQEREQMIFVIQIYFLFLPKIMLPATKSS